MSVAIVAVLLIISIAAFVYMLSSAISSQNAKNWAKLQVYQALISMILLLIFLGLFYVFLINPVPAYNSVGLTPSQCNDSVSVNTLFSLSACDLGTFNQNAFAYFNALTYIAFAAGSSPGFSTGLEPSIGLGVTGDLDSIFPSGLESMLSTGLSAIIFLLVLNNLQLLLISGSILFLTFFLTLGLIARIFGFTRTFGGAMIAFGLGLGIIYPLLISLTYGYIDVNMLSASGIISLTPSFAVDFLSFVANGSLLSIPNSLIKALGFMISGLTFIPFINFLILDAFIIDFSKAIGEKVSFMALLSNFI